MGDGSKLIWNPNLRLRFRAHVILALLRSPASNNDPEPYNDLSIASIPNVTPYKEFSCKADTNSYLGYLLIPTQLFPQNSIPRSATWSNGTEKSSACPLTKPQLRPPPKKNEINRLKLIRQAMANKSRIDENPPLTQPLPSAEENSKRHRDIQHVLRTRRPSNTSAAPLAISERRPRPSTHSNHSQPAGQTSCAPVLEEALRRMENHDKLAKSMLDKYYAARQLAGGNLGQVQEGQHPRETAGYDLSRDPRLQR